MLADADAIDVAAAFAGQAFVSSLAQQDRQLSFELLIALLEVRPALRSPAQRPLAASASPTAPWRS